jgi:hypothetical protein
MLHQFFELKQFPHPVSKNSISASAGAAVMYQLAILFDQLVFSFEQITLLVVLPPTRSTQVQDLSGCWIQSLERIVDATSGLGHDVDRSVYGILTSHDLPIFKGLPVAGLLSSASSVQQLAGRFQVDRLSCILRSRLSGVGLRFLFGCHRRTKTSASPNKEHTKKNLLDATSPPVRLANDCAFSGGAQAPSVCNPRLCGPFPEVTHLAVLSARLGKKPHFRRTVGRRQLIHNLLAIAQVDDSKKTASSCR